MRRFLSKLIRDFRSTNVARPARRAPSRAGLQVESLERRAVLSASSALPHAVSATASDPAVERVFYINKSDHALYAATADTTGYLTPWILTGWSHTPSSVQTLSAGHGANGDSDVVIEAGDGSLWEDTFTGGANIGQMLNWKELLGPGQVKSFAAVDGGRVFAIFSDGTLHLWGGAAWSTVPTPTTTVKAIDAVTDKFGHDTVYVLNGDSTFGEVTYLPPVSLPGAMSKAVANKASLVTGPIGGGGVSLQAHYTQLAAAGHIVFQGKILGTFPTVNNFRAGTDANGYADVFATWWTGGLYENVGNTAAGWSQFAAAGTFKEYSPIDQGHVWITGAKGSLTLYTAPGKAAIDPRLGAVSLPGPFSSITGVGAGGDFAWGVFYVDPSGELLYTVYDPAHGSYNNGGASSSVFPFLG